MDEDVSSKLIDKESFEISIHKPNQFLRNNTITAKKHSRQMDEVTV